MNRGMFGYEGEGFDYAPDAGRSTGARGGWNIGAEDDRGIAQTSHRGRGPKNYARADERIREDVCERLSLDHHLDATDIDVTVRDGVVVLEGSVTARRDKRRAEDLSDVVRGVKDVQNNLRITDQG